MTPSCLAIVGTRTLYAHCGAPHAFVATYARNSPCVTWRCSAHRPARGAYASVRRLTAAELTLPLPLEIP